MRWNEWHHLYLGLGIAIAGCFLKNLIIIGIGLGIALDDWIQHYFKIEGKTPLHIVYVWIYKKSGLIRKINKWFDDIFKHKGLPK